MSRSCVVNALGVFVLLAAAACSKPSSGQATSSEPAATDDKTTTTQAVSEGTGGGGGAIDSAKAKEIFNSRCATCHGPEGRGNGPGAVTLNPKPRNYHDKDWQAKVTDEDIKKTITYGGAAVGKSPMMPASPDLEAKPQVVAGLVAMIRDFGK